LCIKASNRERCNEAVPVKIRILGSAAGGGFPQWNCNAPLSRAVREGRPGFLARTQSSIAVSADGESWAIFNASPDMRQQIAAAPSLQPRPDGPLRHSPIEAVVLTNADVDHIAGLINLREREPFSLYATPRVLETLAANNIFNVLDAEIVPRRALPFNRPLALEGPDGPLGVTIEAFPVAGKVALFLEEKGQADANFGTVEGDTIGLRIAADGAGQERACYYIPGCAAIDGALLDRIYGAGCLMFDGTVFTDDEMREAGVGTKTGARMGHLAISGPGGSLAGFQHLRAGRRIYVHINTTNPILEPGSAAEQQVRNAGWEVGFDGMEIAL
jgi:pyrroloquinoline quinone biosynthesis protein B